MIFVVGTDTGCGKTTVGRALLAALAARGLRLGVVKPVETGCEPGEDGEPVPADALALARAAGLEGAALDEICPYRFALPASPERAAEAEGALVELGPIEAAVAAARRRADLVLVEGAGGLLVPLAPGLMTPELVRALAAPVLVVGRDALGTVNHTLLTVEAVRARGLALLGVVLSAGDRTRPELRNAEAVRALGRLELLGVLPFLPGASDEALGQAAEASLELDRLVARARELAGPGPDRAARRP